MIASSRDRVAMSVASVCVVRVGLSIPPPPPPPPPPPAAQKDEIELSLPLSLYHTARRDPERVKQYQPQYEIISIRYNIHAPK